MDYATESPSRKKARLQSDSGAGLRLKWSIETKIRNCIALLREGLFFVSNNDLEEH